MSVVTTVEQRVWGMPGAKGIVRDLGHYTGRPHVRVFCPRCGEFWLDEPSIKYHLCGLESCIERNIRLVIVRRNG